LGLYSRVQDFEDGFQFFFVRNISLFCTSDICSVEEEAAAEEEEAEAEEDEEQEQQENLGG
jgi:hypothetical protein